MDAGPVLALQIAAVAVVAALVIAVLGAAWCARDHAGGGAAAVHDVERALGSATITTYAQAVQSGKAPAAGTDGGDEKKKEECCAICLSEFAGGDELVRVVPACGHFFHAGCGVDGWLRSRGTCPLCRGRLWPLPRPPRPECSPMPPRAGRTTVRLL